MSTQTIPQVNPPIPSVTPIEAGKFRGHLASFALGCFNYLLAYHVSREVAHKIASDYASDIGRGMSENLEIISAVGKAKKNGESVVTFSGKTNAVTQTYAMSLVRVCTLQEKLRDEKFFSKRPALADMPLRAELVEYLSDAASWAAMKEWKD